MIAWTVLIDIESFGPVRGEEDLSENAVKCEPLVVPPYTTSDEGNVRLVRDRM